MGKINAEWHRAHRMPANPTIKQRAEWHYQHVLNCGCRALTPSVESLLMSQGYDIAKENGGAPRAADLQVDDEMLTSI